MQKRSELSKKYAYGYPVPLHDYLAVWQGWIGISQLSVADGVILLYLCCLVWLETFDMVRLFTSQYGADRF